MYAVIKAGGKQQRVKPGDVIEVERLDGADGTVTFQPILVVDDDGKAHVGKDVAKAVVTGKLLGDQKGDKVRVFKFKPKSGYARRQGHRQILTLVEIQDVKLSARRSPAKKSPAAKEAPAKDAPAKEPAAEEETAAD